MKYKGTPRWGGALGRRGTLEHDSGDVEGMEASGTWEDGLGEDRQGQIMKIPKTPFLCLLILKINQMVCSKRS